MEKATRVEELKKENQLLRNKIEEAQQQRLNSSTLKNEIEKFVKESENNIIEMNQKVTEEGATQNEKLHQLTIQYEGILKNQIQLLTVNKELSEKKENKDQDFNQIAEKLTAEYEGKIKQFQSKVKKNMKRIQEMSGANAIKRLLKNDKFKEEMIGRGINIEVLEKQNQLEEVSQQVEELEQQISQSQKKSDKLDEQLGKMRELIDTMKELLDNMVKQKENVVKQNVILREKLQQSEQLIERLIGGMTDQDLKDGEGEQGKCQPESENKE